MIATERARIRTAYYLSDLEHTSAVNITRGMPTIERTAIDFNLAHHDSFGYWESAAPDETYSLIPHGWTEEPFKPAEPFSDEELWNAEGCPVHVIVGGYPCEIDGHEQPETLPDETPGVPEPTRHPARASVRSEVADGVVLTGYAQCTFDEFPDLSPDDREDIRQDLATGLCAMADRAIANGRTPRIRRDILRSTRDRLVARKRKESKTLPSVAVADENAAANAREALETERMSRQANAWRLHLVEMERLRQQTPALSGTRLL